MKFHYIETGNNNLPTVLMLHGFMGSLLDWENITPFIDDKLHCLALDLPGHGKTIVDGSDNNYSMEKTADGIIGLLNEKNINSCHLIAYSMGGRLGVYLAINYPEYFDKIILESTSPGLKTKSERDDRIKRDEKLARKIIETDFNDFIEMWYRQPLFASLRRDNNKLNEMKKTRIANKEGYALSLRYMGTGVQPSLWDELNKIKNPTLLIAGELDIKFKTIAEQMVTMMPSAQLDIIPDTGHNIHFEMTEAYISVIRRFLVD